MTLNKRSLKDNMKKNMMIRLACVLIAIPLMVALFDAVAEQISPVFHHTAHAFVQPDPGFNSIDQNKVRKYYAFRKILIYTGAIAGFFVGQALSILIQEKQRTSG